MADEAKSATFLKSAVFEKRRFFLLTFYGAYVYNRDTKVILLKINRSYKNDFVYEKAVFEEGAILPFCS